MASAAAPYRKPIEHAGHSYQQQLIRTYAVGDPQNVLHPSESSESSKPAKSTPSHRPPAHDAAKSLASKIAIGSDDLYELLELGDKRWHATADDIKKSFRRISLIYHPDKISHYGDEAKENAEAHFKSVMKAYDILSDKKRRAAYDSIDDVDDSIPSEKDGTHSPQRFYDKFGSCFDLNARWSVSDRVPKLGDDSTPINDVHAFYDFWYSFKSWRDFSFDTEYDPDQAECREEKRWMERQNAKNVKTKKLEENARIRKLVDLAYKHDPRILREKRALKAKKDAQKEQKKRKAEEAMRVEKEKEQKKRLEEERQAAEDKLKKAAAKKQKDAQRQVVRKARQKLRAIGRELKIMDTENGLVAIESMCSEGNAESILALADALADLPRGNGDLATLAYQILNKARSQPQLPISDIPTPVDSQAKESKGDDLTDSSSVSHDADYDHAANDFAKELQNGAVSDQLANGSKPVQSSQASVWTPEELSLLSKAVAKYPGGTTDRWGRISAFVGTKNADEVLRKVNESRPSKIKPGAQRKASKSAESEAQAFARFQEKKKGKPVLPQERSSTSPPAASASTPSQPPNKFHFTPRQQSMFEAALKKYPKGKGDRWGKIAAAVGRSAEDCQQRFNELIAFYAAKKGTK